MYNNWALSSSPACPLPCPTCRAGLPAREDWPQQRFPVLGTVSVEEVRNSAQRRAGTGGPSLGTGGPSLGTGGPSLCPGGRHDTDLACDADTTTSTTALANTSTTATATTTTTKNSNNTAAAPERRERRCVVHPEERLRFYCRPCREPICRDCKMAAHERHAALDLGDKGAEARTLVHIVSQVRRMTRMMVVVVVVMMLMVVVVMMLMVVVVMMLNILVLLLLLILRRRKRMMAVMMTMVVMTKTTTPTQ